MRGHNICFMQNQQKLSLIITKYSLLSKALHGILNFDSAAMFSLVAVQPAAYNTITGEQIYIFMCLSKYGMT